MIEKQGMLCEIWCKGIFVFAAVSPAVFFISHSPPSSGFLWPNLDKRLLSQRCNDPSVHAAGLEFSSGIPWILSGAYSISVWWFLSYSSLSSRLVLWVVFFLIYFDFYFPNYFPAVFIGLFPVWRSWEHWHRRCVRKRTALPLFVTMGQGSAKPALLGMMLREQFSPPSWVVPGTRWWTALVIPHLACRRFCCPIPSSPPRATFSCVWCK